MEQQDTGAESVVSPAPGATKSKLDTLSKDDLIKFAKKQMAAMQKMKSKCANLEKEVDALKSQPHVKTDDSIIQELTDRMNALLLEKAENQQCAMLLQKENEKIKRQEQDTAEKMKTLLGELDQAKQDHRREMAALENTIHVSQAKHKEEVEFFQKLLREREERDREKDSEREKEKQRDGEEEDTNKGVEDGSSRLESQILSLQMELAAAVERSVHEAAVLQEDHQMALTKAQQEVENLREELAQLNVQHEEELRAVEEDFELERDRLLLLQEELSEQLALKDSFLQDVQEEEEEPNGRSSGIARMLELSGISHIDASDGEMEMGRLRSALEDLRSQNTMLKDELTFLGNVKTELEAELERVKEEFQTEKEELEFKIDELLMSRDGATPDLNITPKHDPLSPVPPNSCDITQTPALAQSKHSAPQGDQADGLPASLDFPSSPKQSQPWLLLDAEPNLSVEEQQRLMLEVQELKAWCKKLADENSQALGERDSMARERIQVVAEYEHTRNILRSLEAELDQKTGDFVKQYEAMKEQGALAVQELQDRVRALTEERESLAGSLRRLDEDNEGLLLKVQGLEKKLDVSLEQIEAAKGLKDQLQSSLEEKTASASLEEKTALAHELKASVEDLSRQNGEILSQLQMRESTAQELAEALSTGTTERDRRMSAQQEREAELLILREDRELGESQRQEVEELQARVEELEKERNMLRSNLEEVVRDTEALQRDLAEMKLANEKMRTENQEVHAQYIHVAETLRDSERDETRAGDMEGEKKEEETERERRALEQQLMEKETVISQLRSEVTVLQSTALSPIPEGNAASEKIALLEKESKEKDERMAKIRAVAVKARKELENSRKEVAALKEDVEVLKAERERVSNSMKDIIHGAEGYKNLQLDYDKQTEQLDREKEKAEDAEKQISVLTKRLSAAVQQHEQLSSEREDLVAGTETLRSAVRHMEGQTAELHRQIDSLNKDLQDERVLKEQKTKDLLSMQKEVEEMTAQLHRQRQQSQQTAQELEQLRKEAQQSSLLGMEMADYERLVKELNAKLEEQDVCVDELKTQIHAHTQKEDALSQEIEGLKSQLDQGEEKNSKMKQLLVKTKKDLADAKRQEAAQMMTLASLKGELESHQQQLESSKIQCCDLTAECHRLQEQLRTQTEQQQRTSSSLQLRLSTLQQEANTAKAELSSVTTEFDSYKVRVHNVLKQQKNKSSSQSDGDATKQEREQMESVVDQLKAKLKESQQSLAVNTAELQQIQVEHDTLLERHNKILQENVSKEAELRERLLTLQAETMSLRTENAQTVSQLTAQADAQRSGFRDQIRHLQDEHRTTVETLQNQMTKLENQLFTLQSQNSPAPVQGSRKSGVDRRPVEQGGLGLALSDLQSMAREEGEGMETADTESLSPTHTPLPTLEQLLASPDPKLEPVVWQIEPSKDELSQNLATAKRSMEHMNSLLHETEATNAVLMEQVNLLKSEVRRLERNHEREKSVANLEYLKNVLLQFIFLRSGSERQALLPVIHTMLQLSPEEKNKLAAIAMGEEEVGGARVSGWGSYLHSWSGIR
ncbi:hypothetical protein UPYG_G00307830 [Umbra pygmaea]|uniref:GRIP domain-containing protein n=1 Tax=Umbra pygmaea TaxID=75934 RepID=A0ABD0W010_UMBPY